MKIFGCLIAALIGVAMACLMMQVVLYIGLSFGASYAARLLPGGLGTMVGDEIEAWVMGNPAQNVAEDGPMFDKPDHGAVDKLDLADAAKIRLAVGSGS